MSKPSITNLYFSPIFVLSVPYNTSSTFVNVFVIAEFVVASSSTFTVILSAVNFVVSMLAKYLSVILKYTVTILVLVFISVS